MRILDNVIEIAVGLLLIAYVGLLAVGAVMNTTFTSGDTTVNTLATTVLPVLAIIAFVLLVVNAVKSKGRK